MKISKLLLAALFLGQALAYQAHAAIDEDTQKKALEWAKQNNPQPIEEPKKEEKKKQEKKKEEKQEKKHSSSSKTTLPYSTIIDIGDYRGSTFFSLMLKTVKPALDSYAINGFKVVDGDAVEAALSKVDKKVSTNAIRAAGSVEKLKQIADVLASSGRSYTFYELPDAIAQAGGSTGRFGLATFYALVSGGGVAVKMVDGTYAYNVNYGTGQTAKDEMTGRSFGEAPGRYALDASDAHYLTTLEAYVRSAGSSVESFYASILDILINNDTSRFAEISNEGQAVASDFIAVYVAEQDRHLMANLQTHHWDAALLEVTLLSAFHAGQKEVAVMYDQQLTTRTKKQDDGCSTEEKVDKKAGMVDYWQFSKSTDPQNCNRSGINVTRKEFRLLGRMITEFERKRNPKLVSSIEHHLDGVQLSGNIFADLSSFLINYKTPHQLDGKTLELASDYAKFLMQVRADADDITKYIQSK